jgi:hypothetical protein
VSALAAANALAAAKPVRRGATKWIPTTCPGCSSEPGRSFTTELEGFGNQKYRLVSRFECGSYATQVIECEICRPTHDVTFGPVVAELKCCPEGAD